MGSVDKELIAKVRAGDTDAFAGLVDRHRDHVYRIAFRIVLDAGAAEEVAQEAFVKAFRRLGRFKAESSFSTWLYRVAVNVALDWRRRWRRPDVLSIEDYPTGAENIVGDQPRPDQTAHSLDVAERIDTALASLPGKFREVLVLRDWEGLSYAEIEQLLGLRKGTVESRLYRARERMKELLGPYL